MDRNRMGNLHLQDIQYIYNMIHNSEQINLEKTVVEKDLGVYVDKDLNFY